ncbi:uncharacterized protein LOC120403269 [Mauremys reevesii]|uniref:uncharacterized protein LOC120403269 n=1 Tax=Mauremys reevesii TaxID=260615 RepID=UPI00193F216E|nr:uncharacterized protein LOC120403269 [Mauremys reevesii]
MSRSFFVRGLNALQIRHLSARAAAQGGKGWRRGQRVQPVFSRGRPAFRWSRAGRSLLRRSARRGRFPAGAATSAGLSRDSGAARRGCRSPTCAGRRAGLGAAGAGRWEVGGGRARTLAAKTTPRYEDGSQFALRIGPGCQRGDPVWYVAPQAEDPMTGARHFGAWRCRMLGCVLPCLQHRGSPEGSCELQTCPSQQWPPIPYEPLLEGVLGILGLQTMN